jgi:hypothetical protein
MHIGFQRVCAWSGPACVTLFFLAFLIAGWIPPMSPDLTAQEVSTYYREHTAAIRIGAVMMFLSAAFYIMWVAVISGQMRRIRSVSPVAVYAQLGAGAFACITFMLPAMLFLVTAFRPDRDPADTQLLNDMSWILLVIAWPPFASQQLTFAYSILADRSDAPVFPRWLAYLNIWVVFGYAPATLLAFFKTGPLAWNGLFGFWIPATVFIAMFASNTAMLLKAITAERDTHQATPTATL